MNILTPMNVKYSSQARLNIVMMSIAEAAGYFWKNGDFIWLVLLTSLLLSISAARLIQKFTEPGIYKDSRGRLTFFLNGPYWTYGLQKTDFKPVYDGRWWASADEQGFVPCFNDLPDKMQLASISFIVLYLFCSVIVFWSAIKDGNLYGLGSLLTACGLFKHHMNVLKLDADTIYIVKNQLFAAPSGFLYAKVFTS